MLTYYEFWQHYNILGDFLDPIYCIYAETAICAFAINIVFVTSGISRYWSTRVLDKILDRVLEQ